MNVVGNPIEMDDQEFIFLIENLKMKLKDLKCHDCKRESIMYFSMKDPSYKKFDICCEEFTVSVYEKVSSIVENLPKRK